MKDLCVVKFKDGRYAIRKMDCNLDFSYLKLHKTTWGSYIWWRYDNSEDFKDCCTTDSKKEILKKVDKIVNKLEEESNVEVIRKFFCDAELD